MRTYTLVHNFATYWPIFITLSLTHSAVNLQVIFIRDSTTPHRHLCTLFFFIGKYKCSTRNTLDCDQSNYSSRIVFSHIPIEFGQTENSAMGSTNVQQEIL